ncbi:N-6 DNA methylase [Polynucleobacter sphagniphilus]|uniref:N-6 DNA methylase n=1 Tax=Polynucleobacter sphagniphilus TaxID=1743169 RepID=UPI00247368D5|nr:N-6 DNA methylase [Polynucleobacter sphagniphilus]MDH6524780.1 type I restriction enzyme M protein [Polynucleobacter sphagniphilus]
MFISLTEAATLLGVNKETLRNWDRSGKLRSHRDPSNNYRYYKLSDVQALKTPTLFESSDQLLSQELLKDPPLDLDKNFKRSLSRIHKILRDTDGSSSLVERFDEVTKLIFLKLLSEKSTTDFFQKKNTESEAAYTKRLKLDFFKRASDAGNLFPQKFKHISLSDEALKQAAAVIGGVDLTASQQDVKGHAYEEMIKNTFDKGDHQQFFTPHSIVEFLVALVGDDIKGSVCDPASGTGGFLVEIVKQQKQAKKLVGIEIDERLAWVTGINLQVHGASNFETHHIAEGGSLGQSGKKFINSFDVIITNPPFGSDFSGKDIDGYKLGKGKTSRRRGVLFIERCLSNLKSNGILGMVIDDGVLSLPTNEDVRRLILDQSELLAVISLPDSAFMPYATVATSILLLRKRGGKSSQNKTFFARAENVGRKPNGESDVLYDETGLAYLNNDLPHILNMWQQFKADTTIETSESIYLANIPLSEEPVNHDSCRLDFRFHHPSRLAAEAVLSSSKRHFKKLSDLCNVRNESFIPSIDFEDQMIPYTGLAQIESRVGRVQQIMVSGDSLKSAVKRYERGDILFAKMRPSLRKVAYIDFLEAGYASAECIVLTIRRHQGKLLIDPKLLSILLRSDFVYGQIIHLIAGIGRPRISLKDFMNVKVPLLDEKKQKQLIQDFLKKKELYEERRAEAKMLSEEAINAELEAIEDIGRQFARI